MAQPKRVQVLSGVLVVTAIAAAVYFFFNTPGKRPPPSESGFYYTGPMRSKGNPNIFADENGHIVPPPPDTKAPGSAVKKAPESATEKSADKAGTETDGKKEQAAPTGKGDS